MTSLAIVTLKLSWTYFPTAIRCCSSVVVVAVNTVIIVCCFVHSRDWFRINPMEIVVIGARSLTSAEGTKKEVSTWVEFHGRSEQRSVLF